MLHVSGRDHRVSGQCGRVPTQVVSVSQLSVSMVGSASLTGLHACSLKGLSDADIAALQRLVDDQVAENLGMAMIYTIIAAAQEWLRDKVRAPSSISSNLIV